MASEDTLNCAFTGQSLITDSLSPADTSRFDRLRDWIGEQDVRFTNLEVTVNEDPRWLMRERFAKVVEPEIIDELEEFNFNLFSLANNHAWDAGNNGIIDTIEEFDKRSLAHAGTGIDLEDATKPATLETEHGTVGLLAMASGAVPTQAYAADFETGSRPGINPLEITSYYQVPGDEYGRVMEIADNFTPEFSMWKGYNHTGNQQNSFIREPALASLFLEGDEYSLVRKIDEHDRERQLSMIEQKADQVDTMLVYFHHHYWERNPREVAEWLRSFAHECIDTGADAFVTHGVPAVLPIEIYQNSPIFYSLGNFIFHGHTSIDGWVDPKVWRSIVVQAPFANGEWETLRARPITLEVNEADNNDTGGNAPMFAEGDEAQEILNDLQEISQPFGTSIEIEGDEAKIFIEN